MIILKIINYPNKILREKTKPVTKFNLKLSNLIKNMLDTINYHKAIGLAANQVNIMKSIILIKLNKKMLPLILINPKIISFYDKLTINSTEGCLSLPNYWGVIIRYKKIKVCAINQYNQTLKFTASNDLSVCIQHEIDHLNGKLLIDYKKYDR